MKFRYNILNKCINNEPEIKFKDIENIINELEFYGLKYVINLFSEL